VAALSNMLFPSATLAEGIAKDFSETSHVLLRLRVSHPIFVDYSRRFSGVFGRLDKNADARKSIGRSLANVLTILILIQFAWGAITL
jgi:cytochrome c oxidase assembly protein subunit 15